MKPWEINDPFADSQHFESNMPKDPWSAHRQKKDGHFPKGARPRRQSLIVNFKPRKWGEGAPYVHVWKNGPVLDHIFDADEEMMAEIERVNKSLE